VGLSNDTSLDMRKPRFTHPNPTVWPNGAKIAFSIGVPFEAFGLRSQYAQKVKPGKRDIFSLSFGDYGWKSGVWRILDLLDEFGLKATFTPSGLAADKHPEALAAAVREGHECAGHGWVNDDDMSEMSIDDETALIRKCAAAIEAATGARPRGWVSPGNSGSDNTPGLLVREGFLWQGDDASDDLPFVETTQHGPLVVLPKTNIPHNDLVVWLSHWNSPDVMWETFQQSFDQLWMEGAHGDPKWIELTLHSHVAGRPTLIPALRRCIQYALDRGDIWQARKSEIAEWTLKRATNKS
jgi:peptidoglycan/xylan/chitin deacetylase (PgdA/CDA1 family)